MDRVILCSRVHALWDLLAPLCMRMHQSLLRCMLHRTVYGPEPSLTLRAPIVQATLDALVESSQGDMRLMLGQLQMHRLRAKTLSFDQVRAASVKDMDKSPFDCARRLLSGESAQWSMMDRMDAVFQDLDLVPLLIQVCAIIAHSAKSAIASAVSPAVQRRACCVDS